MADEIIIERVTLSKDTVRVDDPFQMLISVSGGIGPFVFPFKNEGAKPKLIFIANEEV